LQSRRRRAGDRSERSEQGHPENRLADELAQNVARWRHDNTGVGVSEQAFDATHFARNSPVPGIPLLRDLFACYSAFIPLLFRFYSAVIALLIPLARDF
jgi:hypothetical protein